MKRSSVLVAMFCMAFAIWAWAGVKDQDFKDTLTITGHATANDSVVAETIPLFDAEEWQGRYDIWIKFDSVTTHYPSGFGLIDSVEVVIKSKFADQWITLDSSKTVYLDTETETFFFRDVNDSAYGEAIYAIIRIADTVGVTTDSVARFPFTVKAKFYYLD